MEIPDEEQTPLTSWTMRKSLAELIRYKEMKISNELLPCLQTLHWKTVDALVARGLASADYVRDVVAISTSLEHTLQLIGSDIMAASQFLGVARAGDESDRIADALAMFLLLPEGGLQVAET